MPYYCTICKNPYKKITKKSNKHKVDKNNTIKSSTYYCDVCEGACQGAAIKSSTYYCDVCEGPCRGAGF